MHTYELFANLPINRISDHNRRIKINGLFTKNSTDGSGGAGR